MQTENKLHMDQLIRLGSGALTICLNVIAIETLLRACLGQDSIRAIDPLKKLIIYLPISLLVISYLRRKRRVTP